MSRCVARHRSGEIAQGFAKAEPLQDLGANPFEHAAALLLKRFRERGDRPRRSHDLVLGVGDRAGSGAFHDTGGRRPNAEQGRAELVVELARESLALALLDRHQAVDEQAIVGSCPGERFRELVEPRADLVQLRDLDLGQGIESSLPQAAEPFDQVAERLQRPPRGDQDRDRDRHRDGGQERDEEGEAAPDLGRFIRGTRRHHERSVRCAANRHRIVRDDSFGREETQRPGRCAHGRRRLARALARDEDDPDMANLLEVSLQLPENGRGIRCGTEVVERMTDHQAREIDARQCLGIDPVARGEQRDDDRRDDAGTEHE